MKVAASSVFIFLYSTAVKSDNVLYLSNLTCDSSYPVSVSDVSFSCAEGCVFGATGNFTSSLEYSNLDVEDLYTTALMNFTAFTNESAYTYEVTDAGFSQQMFFGSMVDLCEGDDDSCSLSGGNFSANFEYSIPSAGDLNEYFAGFNVASSVKIYDYYNDMGVLGSCLALFTTEAPTAASTSYTSIASNTVYFFAFAAAAFITYVFLLPSKDKKDDKKIDLLQTGSSEDNDPDVIERERSVFKGLSTPEYDNGYDFEPDVLSPVHEETTSALQEAKTESEQIVTEEIPWPSKDEHTFDAPEAPISEITQDVVVDSSLPPAAADDTPPKDDVVEAGGTTTDIKVEGINIC